MGFTINKENKKVSDHFWWTEVACQDKDRTMPPDEYLDNVRKIAEDMEIIRKALGNKPINVNSWYRTKEYNDKLEESSPVSQHLTASAVDFYTSYHTPKEIYLVCEALMNIGMIEVGGLGLYNTFVHYDIRGKKKRWDLRKG